MYIRPPVPEATVMLFLVVANQRTWVLPNGSLHQKRQISPYHEGNTLQGPHDVAPSKRSMYTVYTQT